MKVLEPGHIYELDCFDAEGTYKHRLCFVNRETSSKHTGTQTQEVLRAQIDALNVLIDRTNHCDACLPWTGNERIIKAMSEAQRQLRLALLFHEQRAMERKVDKDGWKPEDEPIADDGHFRVTGGRR